MTAIEQPGIMRGVESPALTALRPATLADLDAVCYLELTGFAPGIVEEKSVFARRITAFPEGFLVRDDLSAYFCAEIWAEGPMHPRSDTADSVGGHRYEERYQLNHDIAAFHDPAGSVLYVASMTIAPRWRGQGAGRALFRDGLAHMRQNFPGLRKAVLIVNEAWLGARAIYAGQGFMERGCIEGFFRADGEPARSAIIMELSW